MRNLAAILMLLTLAGGATCAQPPVEIDPADLPILEAFLEHTEALKRHCTPERMAQFAAQPEDITWQASRYIRMPLVAFQLTGQADYLDDFAERLDALLDQMAEDAEGHPGWYGLALELFRHPDHPDEAVDVIITSLTMAGLMTDFAVAVRAAGLEDAWAERINRYLELAWALVDKWDARGNFRVLPDGGAVYITNVRLRPDKAHLTQPHNKHAIAVNALVSLYRATGEATYIEKAARLGARFRRCLTLEDGRYRWNYWDPAGEWDVHPQEPGRWKHWIGAEHRGGYYAHSLSQAVALHELGLLFTYEDIERFVRTQTEVAWNGSFDAPQWFRVDGRPADEGHVYLCRWLAPWDDRVREMAFGAPAQAARMVAREHSWRGGVEAMAWLESKYLLTPGWGGDEPSDAGLVSEWAAGDGAELLAALSAYEVVEPGYQPPRTPAEMPGLR